MRIEFSKKAAKFLKKLDKEIGKQVRSKILLLRKSLEEKKAIPFDELDIKRLKGNWQGFLRIRVGQIRIIITVAIEDERIYVYDICFRGDAYG